MKVALGAAALAALVLAFVLMSCRVPDVDAVMVEPYANALLKMPKFQIKIEDKQLATEIMREMRSAVADRDKMTATAPLWAITLCERDKEGTRVLVYPNARRMRRRADGDEYDVPEKLYPLFARAIRSWWQGALSNESPLSSEEKAVVEQWHRELRLPTGSAQ